MTVDETLLTVERVRYRLTDDRVVAYAYRKCRVPDTYFFGRYIPVVVGSINLSL